MLVCALSCAGLMECVVVLHLLLSACNPPLEAIEHRRGRPLLYYDTVCGLPWPHGLAPLCLT